MIKMRILRVCGLCLLLFCRDSRDDRLRDSRDKKVASEMIDDKEILDLKVVRRVLCTCQLIFTEYFSWQSSRACSTVLPWTA
jgi:hypothetical protein